MSSRSRYRKTIKSKEIKIDPPHLGGQRAIYLHPARFHVVCCGRRWGKTKGGKIFASRTMMRDGGHVGWVSPTTKMAGDVWREFLTTLTPIAKWISVQEKTIILENDAKFTLWTAEHQDAIRGQSFDTVIMDEAAMYKNGNDLWQGIVRPALSDHKGGAYFLSTPRGRNWFWELFELGKTDISYQNWHFPSNTSPYFAEEEFEEAKRTTHERYFRQEFLAEFLLDGGQVFQGASEISILPFVSEGHEWPGEFVMGVDFGREYDPTVISVLNLENSFQVDLVELNKMDFPSQRQAIWDCYNRWNPVTVIAERNSFGMPVIEELEEEGMRIEPFYTTNTSKQDIIDSLALAIQLQDIWLLNDRTQLNQLQAYQMSTTKTGKIAYSAPHGYHDDYVMALALSYHGLKAFASNFGSTIPVL